MTRTRTTPAENYVERAIASLKSGLRMLREGTIDLDDDFTINIWFSLSFRLLESELREQGVIQ